MQKKLLLTAIFAVGVAFTGCSSAERGPSESVGHSHGALTAGWCSAAGHQLLVGDFDGNGLDDLLCHSNLGEIWVALNGSGDFSSSIETYENLGWCSGSLELKTGHMNQDTRTDLVCWSDATGELWVSFAKPDPQTGGVKFMGTDRYSSTGFCPPTLGLRTVLVGDVNGDGRDDAVCHSDANGSIAVRFNDGGGGLPGPDVVQPLSPWCWGMVSTDPHLIPVNQIWLARVASPPWDVPRGPNDTRKDLVCRQLSDGHWWTALSKAAGGYDSTTWDDAMGWCTGETGYPLFGDFDGDGRDDLLCHGRDGRHWIATSDIDGGFHPAWEGLANWCRHDGAEVLTGDFNGDGRTDLLCHDGAGQKWIEYADPDKLRIGGAILSWYSP